MSRLYYARSWHVSPSELSIPPENSHHWEKDTSRRQEKKRYLTVIVLVTAALCRVCGVCKDGQEEVQNGEEQNSRMGVH